MFHPLMSMLTMQVKFIMLKGQKCHFLQSVRQFLTSNNFVAVCYALNPCWSVIHLKSLAAQSPARTLWLLSITLPGPHESGYGKNWRSLITCYCDPLSISQACHTKKQGDQHDQLQRSTTRTLSVPTAVNQLTTHKATCYWCNQAQF